MNKKRFLDGDEYAHKEQLKELSKDELIEKVMKKKRIGTVWAVLLVFIIMIGILGMFVFGYNTAYDQDYEPALEEKNQWKASAINVGKYLCRLNDETYFNTKVYHSKNQALIQCSQHNILIEDGKKV